MTATTTKRNAPDAATKRLMGKVADARQAVTDWRDAGAKIDAEHAPALVSVAVRVANAPHGTKAKVATDLGLRNDNEASRFVGAWKASLAYAARNGIEAPSAFPTFFVMSQNISGADMLTIARSTSSLEAAALAGKTFRVANVKARKARPNDSIQNGTKTAKASNGTVGNAHGGTGDTSAENNGDKGDTVSDTLASAIRSLTRRISDAVDNGTFTATELKALNALEPVILKARKSTKVPANA